METMIKQIAAVSTLMILTVTFWFISIVLAALGVDSHIKYFTGFLVALLLAPVTWRFCLREAKLSNGESHANRKD